MPIMRIDSRLKVRTDCVQKTWPLFYIILFWVLSLFSELYEVMRAMRLCLKKEIWQIVSLRTKS